MTEQERQNKELIELRHATDFMFRLLSFADAHMVASPATVTEPEVGWIKSIGSAGYRHEAVIRAVDAMREAQELRDSLN